MSLYKYSMDYSQKLQFMRVLSIQNKIFPVLKGLKKHFHFCMSESLFQTNANP